MKRLLLAASILALPALAFAQGALTPPATALYGGAPVQTMKSLDQIEARIPLGMVGINTSVLSITQPGSYVLMGDITVTGGNAIVVSAQNVTLDLNGFTISSTSSPASGTGIFLPSGSTFTIRNGHIRGEVMQVDGATFTTAGFLNGIDATYVSNVCVENVSVNGVAAYGISLYNGDGVIRSCRARYCGTTGLRANQVLDSIALKCGGTAIHAGTAADAGTPDVPVPVANGIASRCTGESLAGGHGIFAAIATDCYGTSNSGIGLQASQSATNCTGLTQTGTFGIKVSDDAASLLLGTAQNCKGTVASGAGTGLEAGEASNSIGLAASGIGLHALNASNCQGISQAGPYGLYAEHSANGCFGRVIATESQTSCYGLYAPAAIGCTGRVHSSATNISAHWALRADTAENCSGIASRGNGLYARYSATNCHGGCTFQNGIGLKVETGTANTCSAYSGNGLGGYGVAIKAAIAIGCTTNAEGTIDAPQKFLGTP